jgi:hypothetical protein
MDLGTNREMSLIWRKNRSLDPAPPLSERRLISDN